MIPWLLAAAALHAGDPPAFAVLVFSRTAGFRHDSIPAGVEAIRGLGREHGFAVEATEDPAVFTDAGLARFEVVLFLNTTGDVLDPAQQEALERFVQRGRGFVGVHAAADTEYEWPWYGRLVGAFFKGHPPVQEASVIVTDAAHASTRHLPSPWTRTDEWYDYRAPPPPEVNILLRLDESSYEGGTMGEDHPIAWCHEFDGGRAWYTGGGHRSECFSEQLFLDHLLGGIRWATSASAPAD